MSLASACRVMALAIAATAIYFDFTNRPDKAASAWACAVFVLALDISARLKP